MVLIMSEIILRRRRGQHRDAVQDHRLSRKAGIFCDMHHTVGDMPSHPGLTQLLAGIPIKVLICAQSEIKLALRNAMGISVRTTMLK